MNNNVEEKKEDVETLEHTEELKVEEAPAATEELKVEEAPATAEEIIKQAEEQANKAAEDYSKKEAPVAPQQDRIQLIDTKPKLHAVKIGGVAMSTENQDGTEIKEVDISTKESPKVEDNPQDNVGPSKLRVFGLIVTFIGMLLVVIFLPDISAYIETQKYLRNQPPAEKITTGTLSCTMEDSSENLDYSYTFSFGFTDNKLNRLKSVVEIRGDVSLDEAELDSLKAECDLLNVIVKDMNGISVSCKLANGLFTKSQTFNFSSIVVDDAITAYIEAGGQYPNYRNGDDIDEVEKNLISSNYTCKREK